jgi:hypothetical protein
MIRATTVQHAQRPGPSGWIGDLVRLRFVAGVMLAAVLVASAVSCGGQEGESNTGQAQTGAEADRPSTTAELEVISPKSGEVIKGSVIPLRISLRDARVVSEASNELRPDEGHVHVHLDGELVSMAYGLKQNIRDVAPGPHRIRVEFVAADHAPFEPRLFTDVAVQVKR